MKLISLDCPCKNSTRHGSDLRVDHFLSENHANCIKYGQGQQAAGKSSQSQINQWHGPGQPGDSCPVGVVGKGDIQSFSLGRSGVAEERYEFFLGILKVFVKLFVQKLYQEILV